MNTEEKLREYLIGKGYRIEPSPGYSSSKWYAYRKSDLPKRECEENEGPLQIIIRYYAFLNSTYNPCEIEIVAEYGAVWWRLQAYAVPSETLMERHDEIEAALIRAWNAMEPVEADPAA